MNRTFCVLLQKNETFSRSLTFFAKECCVLLCSLQKNVAFFAFFYVLCKRMLRSLRSFPFFRKERNVLLGPISRQKLKKITEKMERSERKRMQRPTLEHTF